MNSIMENIVSPAVKVFEKTPNILGTLIVVAGFLFYIDRQDQRDQQIVKTQQDTLKIQQAIADERIKNFHAVTERSNEALEKVASALVMSAESEARLVQRFNEFARDRYANTQQTRDIIESLNQVVMRIEATRGNDHIHQTQQ